MKTFVLVSLAVLALMGSACATSSIVRDGSCAAATTTCTLSPTPASGDLVIVFAFHNATTAPSIAVGWTSISTVSSATFGSYRIACQVGTGLSSIGTWTTATQVVAVAYKNTILDEGGSASCTFAQPWLGGIGQNASGNATSTTMSYPTITPASRNSGASWVLTFGSDMTVAPCAPTGTTTIATNGTGPGIGAWDTNGGVASWAAHTCTVASSSWRAFSVEILGDPCGGLTFATSWTCKSSRFGSGSTVAYTSNTAGDLLVACAEGLSADPFGTPTDTAGNTWVAYGEAVTVLTTTQKVQCWYVGSALTSASTNTVTFTGSTFQPPSAIEFTPPSSVFRDVASTNTTSTSSAMTATGVTTHAANELILSITEITGGGSLTGGTLAGGNTPTELGTGASRPNFSFATQTGSGAITPTGSEVVAGIDYSWTVLTFSPTVLPCWSTLTLMGAGCR